MKIWLLTTEYPPQFGGGIGTYCLHSARMFASQGHEVTVITCDPTLEGDRSVDNQDGVRVVRFKPGNQPFYAHLGYSAALSYDFSECVEAEIREQGAPDVIEAQDYLGIGYFLLQKKKVNWPGLTDIPVVVTLHTPKFICDLVDQSPLYRFPNFWIGEMERFCIRAADVVLSPSQYLLDETAKHVDLSDSVCTVIPNPFNLDDLPEPDHAEAENDLVFLGRMEYRKGIVQAIRYLTEMWDEGLQVPLSIIGGDTQFLPKNQMLGELIQEKFKPYCEKGLIRFVGKLPPEQVYRRLTASRAVVIPSLFENYPYTVVEAMALRNVVLASVSGGQSEIIQEIQQNGFLFTHDDAASFKRQLKRVLDLSPEQTEAIGENARRRISEICSYAAVYPQKLQAFETAIGRERSRTFPFIRPRTQHERPHFNGEPGLLSVVIPFYNAGPWIKETVESILASSYRNLEVIIVNDGTNDAESLVALKELAALDAVTVVHKRNEGLPLARNSGASAARGEFVAFIDADDQVAPEFFEWGISLLKGYDNVSFVGSWTQYFEGSEGIWPTWNPEPPYLLVHNPVTSGGLIFRTQDFLAFGINDPEMEYGMEDYESVIKLVKHGCMGVVIPSPLFRYRIRPNSMSRGFNVDNQLYLYQLLTQKHADFYQEFGGEVFSLLNANGPGYLYDNPTWEFPPVGFLVPPPPPPPSSPYVALLKKALRPVKPVLKPVAARLARALNL